MKMENIGVSRRDRVWSNAKVLAVLMTAGIWCTPFQAKQSEDCGSQRHSPTAIVNRDYAEKNVPNNLTREQVDYILKNDNVHDRMKNKIREQYNISLTN